MGSACGAERRVGGQCRRVLGWEVSCVVTVHFESGFGGCSAAPVSADLPLPSAPSLQGAHHQGCPSSSAGTPVSRALLSRPRPPARCLRRVTPSAPLTVASGKVPTSLDLSFLS